MVLPYSGIVIDSVARSYGVTTADILSESRVRYIADARHVCALVITRAHPSAAQVDVANALGRENHSTIINSLRRAHQIMAGVNGHARAEAASKAVAMAQAAIETSEQCPRCGGRGWITT